MHITELITYFFCKKKKVFTVFFVSWAPYDLVLTFFLHFLNSIFPSIKMLFIFSNYVGLLLSFKVLCPRGGLTLKTQNVLNHELMSSMKEYLTQGRWINKLKHILNLQHTRNYFPFPAPENYDLPPSKSQIQITFLYLWVFVQFLNVIAFFFCRNTILGGRQDIEVSGRAAIF